MMKHDETRAMPSMSIEKIDRIIKAHSIETRRTSDGRILAQDVSTQDGETLVEWVDVTDWNNGQLKNWLGY